METWIKLLNEKPNKHGIYKCLCLGYSKDWREEYLKWTSEGFQPLDYGSSGTWAINMNVSHWLKIVEPELPILEAEKLIIETEVFFEHDRLKTFTQQNNIEVFGIYGNSTEYIISNIPDSILSEMRAKFQSNGKHFNIRRS
jgi:hypothetical protein